MSITILANNEGFARIPGPVEHLLSNPRRWIKGQYYKENVQHKPCCCLTGEIYLQYNHDVLFGETGVYDKTLGCLKQIFPNDYHIPLALSTFNDDSDYETVMKLVKLANI